MRPGAKAILSRFLVVLAVLVFGTALTPNYAYAQGGGGGGGGGYDEYFGNAFDKTNLGSTDVDMSGPATGLSGAIRNISYAMTNLLKVIFSIGALISLSLIVLRVMRGDREAAMKMLWYLLASAGGFILLIVVGNFEPSITAGGRSYVSLKQEVATVLVFMLKIVVMISLTLGVINMMRGEQEGLRKVLVTIMVSIGVSILIHVVAAM